MSELGYKVVETGPVARVTLARPERHNAFDDALIQGLTGAFTRLGADKAVRCILLAGEGKSFSAGADLGWMARMADYDFDTNLADAMDLAGLMRAIAEAPKPVIALIDGPAYGGGVGLAAACDIALGTPRARFCLSEVRLGLIPSAIGPYVVAAIGARAARRYFLTAEAFGAEEALRLGLLHDILPDADALGAKAGEIAARVAAAGPNAVAAAKDLIGAVDRPLSDDLRADTARRIAELRASPEGREGIAAFLEKRAPAWMDET